jgi:hypothetical protein
MCNKIKSKDEANRYCIVPLFPMNESIVEIITEKIMLIEAHAIINSAEDSFCLDLCDKKNTNRILENNIQNSYKKNKKSNCK